MNTPIGSAPADPNVGWMAWALGALGAIILFIMSLASKSLSSKLKQIDVCMKDLSDMRLILEKRIAKQDKQLALMSAHLKIKIPHFGDDDDGDDT